MQAINLNDLIVLLILGTVITNLITIAITKGYWLIRINELHRTISLLKKNQEEIFYNEPLIRIFTGNPIKAFNEIKKLDPSAQLTPVDEASFLAQIETKISTEMLLRLPYITNVFSPENYIGSITF